MHQPSIGSAQAGQGTWPYASHFLKALLAYLSLFGGRVLAAPSPAETEPPNIIFILLDDAGPHDVGFGGNHFVETPHMDQLAKEGTIFTQAYATHCYCSPTRQSLLSGMHPARTCWTKRHEAAPREVAPAAAYSPMSHRGAYWTRLPTEYRSIAELLNEAGYRTAHIGKWHYLTAGIEPRDLGFDVGFGGGCHIGNADSFYYPFMRTDNPRRGTIDLPAVEGDYLTDRLNEEAVAFIQENKDRAFYLQLWHYAVHMPIEGEKKLLEKYREKRRRREDWDLNPGYAAMMESVDQGVGAIRQCLADQGIADRTYIAIASDNGALAQYGALPITSVAPLRGSKGSIREGGIRIPMTIYCPGGGPQPDMVDVPVTVVDLFPTFLEWAGAAPPEDQPVDGTSLATLLASGANHRFRVRPLYWYQPKIAVHTHEGSIQTPSVAIRQGRYKWFHRLGLAGEIYDLEADPGESINIADAIPEMVNRFSVLEQSWLEETDMALPVPNPNYEPTVRVSVQVDAPNLDDWHEVQSWQGEQLDAWRPRSNVQVEHAPRGLKIIADGGYPQVGIPIRPIRPGEYLAELECTAKTSGRFRLHLRAAEGPGDVVELYPRMDGTKSTLYVRFSSKQPITTMNIAGPTHLDSGGHYDPAVHDDYYTIHRFRLLVPRIEMSVDGRDDGVSTRSSRSAPSAVVEGTK